MSIAIWDGLTPGRKGASIVSSRAGQPATVVGLSFRSFVFFAIESREAPRAPSTFCSGISTGSLLFSILYRQSSLVHEYSRIFKGPFGDCWITIFSIGFAGIANENEPSFDV